MKSIAYDCISVEHGQPQWPDHCLCSALSWVIRFQLRHDFSDLFQTWIIRFLATLISSPEHCIENELGTTVIGLSATVGNERLLSFANFTNLSNLTD